MPPKNIVSQLRERESKGRPNVMPINVKTPPSSPRDVSRNPPPAPRKRPRVLGEFKKGGEVMKTGVYKVHKGEVVVPASRAKTVSKMLKKA